MSKAKCQINVKVQMPNEYQISKRDSETMLNQVQHKVQNGTLVMPNLVPN
jgi:hypothetical protein